MKGDQGSPGPIGKMGESGPPGLTGLIGPKGTFLFFLSTKSKPSTNICINNIFDILLMISI